MCNAGACHFYLGLSAEQVQSHNQRGHSCGDTLDLIDGQPTGMVRISFGYMSTTADADAFLAFLQNYFVETRRYLQAPVKGELGAQRLLRLFLYPVKSCGAVEVDEWPIGAHGASFSFSAFCSCISLSFLVFFLCTDLVPCFVRWLGLFLDREWAIVDHTGAALSQKKEPRLCSIRVRLDFTSSKGDDLTLVLSAPHMGDRLLRIDCNSLQQQPTRLDTSLKTDGIPATSAVRVRGSGYVDR